MSISVVRIQTTTKYLECTFTILTSSRRFFLSREDFAAPSANSALLLKIRISLLESVEAFLISSSFSTSRCFKTCDESVQHCTNKITSRIMNVLQSELSVSDSLSSVSVFQHQQRQPVSLSPSVLLACAVAVSCAQAPVLSGHSQSPSKEHVGGLDGKL